MPFSGVDIPSNELALVMSRVIGAMNVMRQVNHIQKVETNLRAHNNIKMSSFSSFGSYKSCKRLAEIHRFVVSASNSSIGQVNNASYEKAVLCPTRHKWQIHSRI